MYFFVVIAGYVFLYLHIQSERVNTSIIQKEIALIQEQNEQFRNLSGVVEDIDVNREKLISFFVDNDKIVDFLETIESLGEISGAEVKVKTINEIKKNEQIPAQLRLNVTADGSWNNVYYFMVLLESLPLKLTFDQVQIRKAHIRNDTSEETSIDEEWLGVFNFRVLKLD